MLRGRAMKTAESHLFLYLSKLHTSATKKICDGSKRSTETRIRSYLLAPCVS